MITVSELNEKIKAILEATFMHIMVEGEVASATYHSSGHLYFSIKDDKSTIKCVMWKSNVKKLKFKIESGEHIVIDGSIGVYSPRGEYQLIAVNIEPYGKGALALAYEQLKAKLEAKGYFKDEHKKPIPKFPKRVAIVTALQGAALQDMLKVARKRWQLVDIFVIDVLVQGDSAKDEISKAIEYADTLDVDVIVVSRGGGSAEDLWVFNEEIVAEAIFKANTPIVSAIGHEVDFLISDFVADLRAPTPSAAIEMILPDFNEYLQLLSEIEDRVKFNISYKLRDKEQKLNELTKQLKLLSPIDRLKMYEREFANTKERLNEAVEYKFKNLYNQLEPLKARVQEAINMQLKEKNSKLKLLSEHLKLSKEQRAVKKGFVEVTKNGKRVDICQVKKDDLIALVSNDCKVEARVL